MIYFLPFLWLLMVSVQAKPADEDVKIDRQRLRIEEQLMQLNRAKVDDRQKEIEFIELKYKFDSIVKPW